MIPDLLDLDATAVVRRTQELALAQRETEVDALRLALQWADLHSEEPASSHSPGRDRLIQLGGEGTPHVQELCWGEPAVARFITVSAMKRLAADSLDLRHRMPILWAAVQDLRLPAWVACKVASMSRGLSLEAVGLVDVAVAAAVDESPTRILRIAEAKVIEADIEAHRARLAEEAAKLGVQVSRPRTGDAIDPVDGQPGALKVSCKLPTGVALGFEATVGDLADKLEEALTPEQRETVTRGELEAQAVELLSNPHAAAAFLDGGTEPDDLPKRPKRPATVYVFLSDLVLSAAVPGVGRVEGIGPVLLDQLCELLKHRDVKLQPVIDLNDSQSVNAYEHPTLVKTRTLLRMLGEVFPHSSNTGYRRLDHDHAEPYVPPDRGGPPGQTGDRNVAPMTRGNHRIKTHVPGVDLVQLDLGVYRWATPHGLGRLVTRTGTRRFTPLRTAGGIVGEIYE
ncbi:hypothetical protein [Nocardioides sp. MH1]|uniref:hypothetical protein n=1 Tax=Nocardioides sp. MH1 TaxID=3242490 RepID=UPI003522D6AD